MKLKIKTIMIALSFIPALVFALDPMSIKDQQLLSQGSMIKKVQWKKGFVWPEVTILVLLSHTPEENLNVFLDYENHKKFIPDMTESKIVKKVSENETHVYFEMEMPWPVNKTSHTINHVVTKNSDGSYLLKWNLVKGEMLKSSDGSMTFSPYEGKTLFKYVSFIVPKSKLAGMFKNKVEKDVEKSVSEITKYIAKTLAKKKN